MKYIVLVFLAILLSGCDWPFARGVVPPDCPHNPTVGCTLVSIGQYLIWAGGAAVAAGLLACAASFIPAIAAFCGALRSLFLEIVLLGFVAILVGSAFLWIGNHPWVLAVVIGAVCLAALYRYRRALFALLRIKKEVKSNA